MAGNIIEKFNPSTGDIKLGEWNVHFKAGLQYAKDNNVPIYVFWSNNGCSQCTTIINSFTSDFIDGAKELKIVLIAIKNYNGGEYNSEAIAAKTWLGSASNYPISKVWWKKPDGNTKQSRWENNATPSQTGDLSNRFLNSIKDCIAGYVPPVDKFTVTFKDWDGKVISTQLVERGKAATAPADPARDGYAFIGWDNQYINVQSDIICVAQYRKILPPTPTPILSAAHVIKISNNIDKLQVIGDSTYPNALQDNLISVELGSNVTTIAPSCFMNCKNLETVIMPRTCRYIGDYAFYGCERLKHVTCIDRIQHYPIFEFGTHCFDGCNSLDDICIDLSNTVSRDATIGEYAFANCTSLKAVTQYKWSYMGSHMFSGCSSLTSINLANTTNYVQEYSLAGIPNLQSIIIPNNIWIISEGMFADDTSLSSIQIKDESGAKSVMMMVNDGAFAGCNSLTSITLPESINDITCCGDFMLAGSSISSITFNGISDGKFVTTGPKPITLKDGYIQDKTEFNIAAEEAVDKHVPMVIFTNHDDIGATHEDGNPCKTLDNNLRSAKWKDFMKKHADDCLFVYANSWRNMFNSAFTSKSIKIPWSHSSQSAKAACVWLKVDGTISIIESSGYSWGTDNDPSTLIETVSNFINRAPSAGAKDILQNATVNATVTKFGSDLPYVTFVSKEGNSHRVYKDTEIVTIPNTRVDNYTTNNFKYGTWYGNAEQLRKFADANGIPCLVEYSKDGCSPCMYFKKNIFKNREFQDWVMKSPYLFFRIEIGKDDNFDNRIKNPSAYYVDKVWAKEIDPTVTQKSIPIFFWYWKNKNGDLIVKDLSSYHFNPDAIGAKPPFSIQELMDMTDQKFATYKRDDEFNRYPTYELSSNEGSVIGMRAPNVDGDTTGVMFPCDSKGNVERYSKTLDLSGYSVINSISVGQEVQYIPNTYYVYDVTYSQRYNPDAYGVIFKVEKNAVDKNIITYILSTSNVTDTPYQPEQKYQVQRWYNLSTDVDASTFDGIIAEAGDNDWPVVILKTNDSSFDEKLLMLSALTSSLPNTYFVQVRSTNWNSGVGLSFKAFQTASHNQATDRSVHFPSWSSTAPLFFTYLQCRTCSDRGPIAYPDVATQIDPSGKDLSVLSSEIIQSLNTNHLQ